MKLNKNRTGRILTVRVRIRLILPVRYPANQYRYPRSGKQKDVQNKQTKRMNREKNLYIFLYCTGDTCTTLCYDIYGTCTEYKYSRYIYKWQVPVPRQDMPAAIWVVMYIRTTSFTSFLQQERESGYQLAEHSRGHDNANCVTLRPLKTIFFARKCVRNCEISLQAKIQIFAVESSTTDNLSTVRTNVSQHCRYIRNVSLVGCQLSNKPPL